MRCIPRGFLVLLLASVACAAQSGSPTASAGPIPDEQPHNGQTGSIGVAMDHGTGIGCAAVATDLAPDTDPGLGFDAQTLIRLVSGEHRASFVWKASTLVRSPAPGNEDSPTAVSIGIDVIGGAQFLQRDGQDRAPDDAPPGAHPGELCPDAIGLPVRVRLRTDDGELDQVAETTIEAAFADFGRAALAFPSDALTGTYRPAPLSSAADAHTVLGVEIGVTPLGPTGSIAVQAVEGDGSRGTSGDTIGHFPSDDCVAKNALNNVVAVPRAAELRGVSLDGILARFSATGPILGHSLAGATTHLSLAVESSASALCLRLEPSLVSSRLSEFEASVRLSSDDGSVDGAFPVQIYLDGDPGALAIKAAQGATGTGISQASETARNFAIQQPIDFTGYDGTDTHFWLSLAGDVLTGRLEVVGWHYIPCSSADASIPPSQCKGNDSTVIWSLDWGNGPS